MVRTREDTGRVRATLTGLLFIVSTAAFADDSRPAVLEGSFPGGAVKVEAGTLIYYEGGSRKSALRPSARQWREFRRRLDEAGVWSWRPKYGRSVTDGFGWKLHAEYADRKIDSEGYAALPPLKSYMRCIYALQQLAGGRHIGGRRVHELELYDVGTLRLVAAHASENPREQWAEFREPRGRVLRVSFDPHAPHGASYLAKVTEQSVVLSELAVDGEGDLVYRSVRFRRRERALQ